MARVHRGRMGPPYYNLVLWKLAETVFWRLRVGAYVPEMIVAEGTLRVYKKLDREIQQLCGVGTMSLSPPTVVPHLKIVPTDNGVRISIDQ